MQGRTTRGGLIQEAAVETTTTGGPGAPPMATGSGEGHPTAIDRLLTGTGWDRSDLDLLASLIIAGGIALDAILTFALLAQA